MAETLSNAQSLREMNNEGAALYAAGDFAGAERLLRNALRRARAEGDTGILDSVVFNLAADYRSQANYAAAEPLYREALSLREAQFGLDHRSLVGPLRGLSFLYLKRADFRTAERFARRAAAIEEKRPSASFDTETAQNDVVKVLVAQGRLQAANEMALRILHRLDAAGASGTMQYAETLNNLGVIARRQGRPAEARHYLLQAVGLYESQMGKSHPSTTAVWNNIAEVEAAQGNLHDAEVHFQLAVSSWQALYGPSHPDVASALANLAGVYRARKQYAKAEKLYLRALSIDRAILGDDHPKTAGDWNNLGTLAFNRRKLDRAEGYFRRALEIDRKTLGAGHADTGLISTNLAVVYYRKKKYLEAEPLFREAIRVREGLEESQGVALAAILECYAQTLRRNQKYSDAAKAEVRATGLRVRHALHPEST